MMGGRDDLDLLGRIVALGRRASEDDGRPGNRAGGPDQLRGSRGHRDHRPREPLDRPLRRGPPRPARPGRGDPPAALPRRRLRHEETSRRPPPRRDQAAPAPHGAGRQRLPDRLPRSRRGLPPGGRGEAARPDPHGDVHLPRRSQRLRGSHALRRRGGRLSEDDPRPLPRRPSALVRHGFLPAPAACERPARHLEHPAQKLLEVLPRLAEAADRVLWGTDWPSKGVKSMRGTSKISCPFRSRARSSGRYSFDNAAALFPV